jgi:hypothetical protein
MHRCQAQPRTLAIAFFRPDLLDLGVQEQIRDVTWLSLARRVGPPASRAAALVSRIAAAPVAADEQSLYHSRTSRLFRL